MKASLLKGRSVFTLDGGKEIGFVKEIIYDTLENKVIALLISNGGLFSKTKVIPFEKIKSLEKDVVVVYQINELTNYPDIYQRAIEIMQNGTYLNKINIITEEGVRLGKVSDIHFDSVSGQVEKFDMSAKKSIYAKPKCWTVHIRDIITMGKDATIVTSYEILDEDEFKNQSLKKNNLYLRIAFLKNLFEQIQHVLDFSHKTVLKMEKLVDMY